MAAINTCSLECNSEKMEHHEAGCPVCNGKGKPVSRITVEHVIQAVVKHGAITVKDVCMMTGAMKNSNCRENNPMGLCCHKIIQEAIDKGLINDPENRPLRLGFSTK